MLELINITKDYPVAGGKVQALKGVSIKFRKNEFVSILGASGCGKTTLLNIIGGLDKYTSGDLLIEGVSTKQYGDRDWDTYRNHSIGFIFQSYHLIPQQTILQNVELALTIAGVAKDERKRRAIEALEKVGLSDKLNNRPNQLSGGQAQRVAIARALINDPEIVLADEPTGALDSKTSVQIMELLKEISKDRLVIMVTHNPELAEKYSTRIIRLLDGTVTDDSMPYDGGEEGLDKGYVGGNLQNNNNDAIIGEGGGKEEDGDTAEKKEGLESPNAEESGEEKEGGAAIPQKKKTNKGRKKKTSMSFGMAFMLSLKNLLSKSKRTIMVSIAGSIGIIGVSMVLAISAGVQGYIDKMEDDMLSGYPLTVAEMAVDINSLMGTAAEQNTKVDPRRIDDKVYVDSVVDSLMEMNNAFVTNIVSEQYIDYVKKMPESYYNAITYDYGTQMANNIFAEYHIKDGDEGEMISVTGIRQTYSSVLMNIATSDKANEAFMYFAGYIPMVRSFSQLPDNYNYVLSQYDIVATSLGKTENLTESQLEDIFENKDSLIMVLNNGATSDLDLAQYGFVSQNYFIDYAENVKHIAQDGKEVTDENNPDLINFDYSQFLGGDKAHFRWYPADTVYVPVDEGEKIPLPSDITTATSQFAEYKYLPKESDFDENREKGDDVDLKVKVILQKKEGVSYGCLASGMYYTKALSDHALKTGRESKLAKYINEHGALAGVPYMLSYQYPADVVHNPIIPSYLISQSDNMMERVMGSFTGSEAVNNKYKIDLSYVGAGELPKTFEIYPLDFEKKELVTDYLDGWNDMCESKAEYTYTAADGSEVKITLDEDYEIEYTDTVGLIISMVNTMIEMITVALVAFTALSLVVSTVMVGIITYVSVVERIKEIGILRAVGARKKDIKRLFMAETFIIGLAAGIVGIAVTYILSLILNLIIGGLFGIYTIAALPIWQAVVMVLISVMLTLISGLLPAAAAAKKDPVVALRTE